MKKVQELTQNFINFIYCIIVQIQLRNNQYQFRNKLAQYSAGTRTVLIIFALCIYMCIVQCLCAVCTSSLHVQYEIFSYCSVCAQIHSFNLKHVFFVRKLFCFSFLHFRSSHFTEADFVYKNVSRAEQWLKI